MMVSEHLHKKVDRIFYSEGRKDDLIWAQRKENTAKNFSIFVSTKFWNYLIFSCFQEIIIISRNLKTISLQKS